MMVGVRSMRVMEVLAEATNTIAEGEVMQLLNVPQRRRRRGSVSGGDPPQDGEALRGCGAARGDARRSAARGRGGLRRLWHALGTAFQLVDDVLDYSGDLHETGKNLGDDLERGQTDAAAHPRMRRGSRRRPRSSGGPSSRAGGRRSPQSSMRSARPARSTSRAAQARARRPPRATRWRRAGDSTYSEVCYTWRPSRSSAITDPSCRHPPPSRIGV